MISRRRWLAGAATAVIGGPALAALYGWRVEPHWLDFAERTMPVEGLPRDMADRRLVQLSDLHIGPAVDEQYLTQALERAAALDADFVVYTGDYVTYDGAERLEQLTRILGAGPRGRLATLATLGNHDYGHNWADTRLADQIAHLLTSEGIRVLRNEIHPVSGIQFVGLDDLWAGKFSTEVLKGLRFGAPAIALSHNPDTLDLPGWEPFRGWVLSGHTHGGQCKPPFLPPPILPIRNRRYAAGHVNLGDGRQLYVNRGLGHLWPVRFNCRPEVTIFRLEHALPTQRV